jgi:DNA/RNA endonuclease YhcR with UshA esterase domain
VKHPGFIVTVIVCLLLVACTSEQTAVAPLVQVSPTATARTLSTDAPTITPTAAASATPSPTVTPTSSPTATATPTPTFTPTPTSLPPTVQATASPEENDRATAVAPPPLTATTIALANLPTHAGEEITVVAQVVAAASFSHGFKFTLDDGSGRATLLLWHNVYDDAWDASQINVGATVRATGEVGQYEGEWQIAPDFGGDVKVTAPGGSFAPSRPIGELSQHVGELAQISGVIERLESSASFVKLFVKDDSGEVVVLVWRTVLDRIPDNVALGTPGTRVQVTGRIELFRSNLQLVPALPYDVTVLP